MSLVATPADLAQQAALEQRFFGGTMFDRRQPPIVNTPPVAPVPSDMGTFGTGARGPGAKPPEEGGFLNRLGTALKKPGMSGAFLRAAGSLFNGDGLGGAIQTGAGYMDHEKAAAAAAQQTDFQNRMEILRQAVAQQQANQTGDYQTGQLTNDALRIQETGRHNRAGEAIDANGQRIQLYGIDTSAATQRRGQDVQVATNAADNFTSRANNAATVEASRYGTDAENYRSGRELAAGIGSKGTYRETQVTTPATPAANPWFGAATPAVPKTVTTTRAPLGTAGDEIRYDASGRAFRRDPATGKPVPVR